MIRKAEISDLPIIVEIYNQAIDATCCTGDMEHFNAETRRPWFELHNNNIRTPIFVYELEGKVVAYGAISLYRYGRKAFERVCEVSYYVDFNYHGNGIGKKLLEYLIIEAKKIGYKHLVAILLDCNKKSISLLEKNEFVLWGKMPDIAHINNNVYSHVYYGLTLK